MYQMKLDTSALPWSPTGWPGVSMKMLQQVESTGGMTGMMRMEAGSSIPAHSHTNADQMVFVVEGDLVEAGVSYGPGSFFVAKAGDAHLPARERNTPVRQPETARSAPLNARSSDAGTASRRPIAPCALRPDP